MDELINNLVGLLKSQQAKDAGIYEVEGPDEDGDITFAHGEDDYTLSIS